MSDRRELKAEVLVIGAGPYGLALAARLQHLGVDYLIAGESMSFWRRNMPAGMFLRSSWDWPLDPQSTFTIERFLNETGRTKAGVTPFPLDDYLEYAEWFRNAAGVQPLPLTISRLDQLDSGDFLARAEDGSSIRAGSVAVAIGFSSFAAVPEELRALLPPGQLRHTLDYVDMHSAAEKSVLIIGGRQSAFEWAALLAEAGAEHVHLVHRHPSPAFEEADWSWVSPMVDRMLDDPGWFRRLPSSERETIAKRLWAEGRLKVEPWLEARLPGEVVTVWPSTEVRSVIKLRNGRLEVLLSTNARLEIDDIVLATGYRADISRVGFLTNGNLANQISDDRGSPVLDERFQTSVPDLYLTSMLAAHDFGPFFGFTVAARAAAIVLGDELARRAQAREGAFGG